MLKYLTSVKQNYMSIHVRLRQIIAKEEISVAEFERKIGVGKNTISYILNKESSVSHSILEKIRNSYAEYSLCWLLTGATDNDLMVACLNDLKANINTVIESFEKKLG